MDNAGLTAAQAAKIEAKRAEKAAKAAAKAAAKKDKKKGQGLGMGCTELRLKVLEAARTGGGGGGGGSTIGTEEIERKLDPFCVGEVRPGASACRSSASSFAETANQHDCRGLLHCIYALQVFDLEDSVAE